MALNCSTQALLWGSSWGAGWGGPSATPGGALPSEAPFTTVCVCGAAAPYLATYIGATETPGNLDHNIQDVDKGVYRLLSGDGVRAGVFLDVPVASSATLECIFTLRKGPVDLTTHESHLFVGLYDDALTCNGLFLSPAGIAYGASYDDKPLPIPNSVGLLSPGETYVLRLVVDDEANVAMVYLSPLEEAKVLGPRLKFVLPLLDVTFAPPHEEGVYLSVLGSESRPTDIEVHALCLAPNALVDDHPPVANPGKDMARRGLAPVRLDGRKSFDPEGGAITYLWRVVGVPETSLHSSSGADGMTLADVSGFVNKLYTEHAGGSEPFPYNSGDALAFEGVLATILSTGSDGDGDYFLLSESVLPAGLSLKGYTLYRQDLLLDRTTARPLLKPDVPGLYRIQLQVKDAALYSPWVSTLVNVLRKEAASGVVPDVGYLWRYLSDTWSLVPDAGRIETVWTAAYQVLGGETLRLWQAGAAKSLQEIPRSVTRRWLAYDLLMREPFPEMSLCEARFAGVESEDLAFGGLDFAGETLVLSVPGWSDLVELTLQAASTPKALAASLQALLREKDPRFSVVDIPQGIFGARLLLQAPFPFLVAAGTTALFTIGRENTPLRGGSASRESAYVLQVDRSLYRRGLKAGDLIRVDGPSDVVVLSVASTVDVPGDLYPHQRIRTNEVIPPGAGGNWSTLLKCTSPQMNFWGGGATVLDPVILDTGDGLLRTTLRGMVEDQPSSIGVDLDATLANTLTAPGAAIRIWGLYRRRHLPVSPRVRGIPTLQANPWEEKEEAILREFVDYEVVTWRGLPMLEFAPALFQPDDQDVVVPRFWAEETILDNSERIEANFGLTVGLHRTDVVEDVDYLSAVRGLRYALSRGPRLESLRVAAQILLGLPFAEERSLIVEIEDGFTPGRSRLLLQDKEDATIFRSYTYSQDLPLEVNPSTGLIYKVGDEVAQFAPLVAGVALLDHKKDPTWIDPFLRQGLMTKLEAIHSYLVRVELTSSLSSAALLFVAKFLQKAKSARTRPLFLVRMRDLDPDAVDVTETLSAVGQLHTYDSGYERPFSLPEDDSPNLAEREGAAGMFDQPDLSPPTTLFSNIEGRTRARFDRDVVPGNIYAPSFDQHISWGWDMGRFAPEQLVSVTRSFVHAGGTIPAELEDELASDLPLLTGPGLLYGRSWVPPFGDLGVKLDGPEDPDVDLDLDTLEVRIVGVPPAGGRSYVVKIFHNGSLAREVEVLHNTSGTQTWRWGPAPAGATLPGGSLTVAPGDSVKVGIYCLEGEQLTQRLRGVSVLLGVGQTWTSGGALAAGTYYLRRALLGYRHASSREPRPPNPGQE